MLGLDFHAWEGYSQPSISVLLSRDQHRAKNLFDVAIEVSEKSIPLAVLDTAGLVSGLYITQIVRGHNPSNVFYFVLH